MECQVCLDPFGESALCLPCGHIFCTGCVDDLSNEALRISSHTLLYPMCRDSSLLTRSTTYIRRVFLDRPAPQTPSSRKKKPASASTTSSVTTRSKQLEKDKEKLLDDAISVANTRAADAAEYKRVLAYTQDALDRTRMDNFHLRNRIYELERLAEKKASRMAHVLSFISGNVMTVIALITLFILLCFVITVDLTRRLWL